MEKVSSIEFSTHQALARQFARWSERWKKDGRLWSFTHKGLCPMMGARLGLGTAPSAEGGYGGRLPFLGKTEWKKWQNGGKSTKGVLCLAQMNKRF